MRKFKLTTILLALIITSQAQWNWQNPYPVGNQLEDIAFIDENTGWAVGKAGTIIYI